MNVSRLCLVVGLAIGACGDDGADASGTVAGSEQSECGKWVRGNKSDMLPPPNATPYGMETNSMGVYNQYVCRFRDMVDGVPVTMQGKGVLGYGCYAILPPSGTAPLRVQASDDYDILVDTASCASMVPYDPSLRLLPTGVDAAGAPSYSCHGIVGSVDVPGKSSPLGRLDVAKKTCIFEWYSNVREAPSPLTDGESFEVLALQ